MKKILGIALGLLLIASNCFADLLTYTTISSDAGVTTQALNDRFSEIKTNENGNIKSVNIYDGSIASEDIAVAANPLKRDGENIGEYVYSGGTIATSVSLASTITAMVAYIQNDADGYLHRVSTAATNKTFTASKDTYVYCDYAGAFIYSEVSNGAGQPTTPSNSIILAKVVTDGTAVASVVDHRQTTPSNLRIYSYLKNGLVISRDAATATKVWIGPGDIELGSSSKKRSNSDWIALDFTTNGFNGLDTGLSLAANTYYYIFAVPSDANSTNFKVVADTASTDTAIVAASDERLIGWCYAPTASAISGDSVGAFKKFGGDAPNIVERSGNTDITTASTSMITMQDMDIRFISSGRPVLIHFNANLLNANDVTGMSISVDSVGVAADNYLYTITAQPHPVHLIAQITLTEGTHYIEGKWKVPSGTGNQYGSLYGPRVLVVQEL